MEDYVPTQDETTIIEWLESESNLEIKQIMEGGLKPSKFIALHSAGLKEMIAAQLRLGKHKSPR